MESHPNVTAAFAFIKYWGSAYEPYSFTMNIFLFFAIIGDFVWKIFGGPEAVLWWSGMGGLGILSWPNYFLAKWSNDIAWNLSYQYAWLYNKDSSIIAATLHWIFVAPWMMLFIIIPEFIEERDFTKMMEGGNYQLTLIDGIIFHYFQYSEYEDYTLWAVIVQNFFDMVLGNPFTWLPMVFEVPLLFGYWITSKILFFNALYIFKPSEIGPQDE